MRMFALLALLVSGCSGRSVPVDEDARPPAVDHSYRADLAPTPDMAPPPPDAAAPDTTSHGPGPITLECPPDAEPCSENGGCPAGYFCIVGCCELVVAP
jgi:hypothetical protein